MPQRLRTNGPQQVGDGPSPRRQHRGEHRHQNPLRCWGGKRGPQCGEYRRRPPGISMAWGLSGERLRSGCQVSLQPFHHKSSRCPPPVPLYATQKGKSRANAIRPRAMICPNPSRRSADTPLGVSPRYRVTAASAMPASALRRFSTTGHCATPWRCARNAGSL
jgi:hypothetical protein